MSEVKEIIEKLKDYYWTKNYISLDGEPSRPELDSLENCAYFAILKTLSKEQLEEANDMLYDHLIPLTFMVFQTLNPKPYNVYNRNESIGTLINRFVDKKSKRVVESRKEILRRFPYLDYAVQKKVIRAFLSSDTLSDREWAAIEADRRWDKSFTDYVAEAFGKKETERLALTVIRHMPIDYVKSKESSLVMFSRAEYCIRLADESDHLIRKYDLSIFEHLYVKARTGQKMKLTDLQVELQFFRYIYTFAQKALFGIYGGYDCLNGVPWIRRAIWALGELGYRDIVMKFLSMKKWVSDQYVNHSDKNRFYYVQQWIIENYFPEAHANETINWNKILEKIESILHPKSIKIDSLYDLEENDDLPPDVIDALSDFI